MGLGREVNNGPPYFHAKDAKAKEEGISYPARLYLRSLGMSSLAK